MNLYQKGIIILLSVAAVAFLAIYFALSFRTGIKYEDEFFRFDEVDGNKTYSGTIDGQKCCFTVTPDKTMTFRCGEKVYGPYVVKEDPTAAPEDDTLSPYYKDKHITGLEILQGDDVFFRGGLVGYLGDVSGIELLNENGEDANSSVTVTMSDGRVIDSSGNVIDQMAPTAHNIIYFLYSDIKCANYIYWFCWWAGLLLSLIVVVSILFADELFRLALVFRVRDSYQVEPSDLVIAGRYISWTIAVIAIIRVYFIGL